MPHQALTDSLAFISDYLPNLPQSVIILFIKKMNKIWLKIEKRKIKRVKEHYEKLILNIKRQVHQAKPYKNVLTEQKVRTLKQQLQQQKMKSYRGTDGSGGSMIRQPEDTLYDDLLDYDSEEERQRENQLPAHHRRLCQEIHHLEQLIERSSSRASHSHTGATGLSGGSHTGSMGSSSSSTAAVVMDAHAARNLLEASLVSLEILGR